MLKELLKFGAGNSKLDKSIVTFTIPSGYTCPGAKLCKAFVVEDAGRRRIVPAQSATFRCFMISQEKLYTALYDMTRYNHKLLIEAKTYEKLTELLEVSLQAFVGTRRKAMTAVRIHVGGDFYKQEYFDAWMTTARSFPELQFYAYTKSIDLWVKHLGTGFIPDNMILTASEGGYHDHLIEKHNLKTVKVVMHPEEAIALNLEIDHDDSHARDPDGNFALLIHGQQESKSDAAVAIQRMKAEGIVNGYSTKLPKEPVIEYNFKTDVASIIKPRKPSEAATL